MNLHVRECVCERVCVCACARVWACVYVPCAWAHACCESVPIHSCWCVQDRHCAFVDFKFEPDCINAFTAMQGRRLGDEVIELGYGKPGHSRDFTAFPTEYSPAHVCSTGYLSFGPIEKNSMFL